MLLMAAPEFNQPSRADRVVHMLDGRFVDATEV
jgi:hypothetical protein